ncbi:MAG: hypothetical protein JW940_01365 [Polyangiaceae bacterium]|nr:hypothetical protein [Polyangiaceae bacterium]
MTFMENALQNKPSQVRSVALPRRTIFRVDAMGNDVPYYPSPVDWASEVLYFLLPDRFSDGLDGSRPAFNFNGPPSSARPPGFRWDNWARGGGERWQGGTLKGITSRLDYLDHLGITAIWVGPIFKQRHHSNEYHGYAIQDFLEVDPHFGSREDLVDLVIAAHERQIRVILDVIFNHSGHNWDYADGSIMPPYRAWPSFYERGQWLDASGNHTPNIGGDRENGIWPEELQRDDCYTRAGSGSLSGDNVDDDHAEIKRSDFPGAFRDFNLDDGTTLNDLARCFKYWIALTDIDGMRLDTLKHVPLGAARNFCGSIKEFAANLGKADFFLVGEVAGSDDKAGRYLDVLELNLNATLDIGSSRIMLTNVAKGLEQPSDYFDMMRPWDEKLGSHRNSAQRHVKPIDDHDHVCGTKVRFSSDASSNHQVCAAAAIDLFTLGIPCLYYGTEQAFAGPERSEREQYLPDYGQGPDKYLRETMFGAPNPRRDGVNSLLPGPAGADTTMPGYGAFGTCGVHFFNENHPAYRRIQHLIMTRRTYPTLRYGRQYQRKIRNFGNPFAFGPGGEIIAWSRILDEEEILCIVNGHGTASRGADVIVDLALNSGTSAKFTVIANSAQAAASGTYQGSHPIGSTLPVKYAGGVAYVELRNVGPSEVVVLTNGP